MLIAAAAKKWNVNASEITAKDFRADPCRQRQDRDLWLAGDRGRENAGARSQEPEAQDPRQYRLFGKRYRGVDDPKVVTGQPLFGIDVQLPGMVYANFTKCPAVGGKVRSFNVDEIKA